MEKVDRDLSVASIGTEERSEAKKEECLDRSMVIYVQQEQPATASNNSSEQQLVTLVPQSFPDTLPALGEDMAGLLGNAGDDALLSQQREGDGQILYVTYTLDDVCANPNIPANEPSSRVVLHVAEDGSTIMLPEVGGFDIIGASEAGLMPQLTVNSVYSLVTSGSFAEDSLAPAADDEKPKLRPFVEINNRRRTEQVIGSELHIEEKLEVLDAMLTPAPERSRKKKESGTEDSEGSYMCDLCDTAFPRATQFYGHLHSHSGERKWECSACPDKVVFSSQSQLRRHEKESHLNLRPHICKICAARFDRVSQLSYHQRRIHAGERAHACQICHKAFFKRSDLKTHLNIHLGINKCICETCGKKFNHVSNLIRHTRMHSGIKPYPCTVCGRRFSQLNALHQHKTSHQTSKDVACTICRKMFKSHMVMRKHMRQLHRESEVSTAPRTRIAGGQSRRFYCKVCGESFEFAALLRQHERQHEKENGFHCSCCGQDLQTVEMLKGHACQTPEERLQRQAEDAAEAERVALSSQLESLLQEHDEPPAGVMGEIIIYVTQEGQDEPTQVRIKSTVDPLLGSSDEPKSLLIMPQQQQQEAPSKMTLLEEAEGSCLDLAASVSSPLFAPAAEVLGDPGHNLDKVSKTEDAEAEVPITPPDSVKKPVRLYQCPECPKTFVKNSNFKQHLGIHFIDQQRYHCQTCGQSFAWKSTLNKHMLSHTAGPLPRYRCDLCTKEYAAATQVQEHIKRDHYKQRPHACCMCSKTFYKKYDLKIHLRTHTKERPYICGTCGKSFYHLSHIIRHERIHSGQRPYRCSDCGRQFNQSSSLKSHRQRQNQCIPKTEPVQSGGALSY